MHNITHIEISGVKYLYTGEPNWLCPMCAYRSRTLICTQKRVASRAHRILARFFKLHFMSLLN
jgi:hypothetical protein